MASVYRRPGRKTWTAFYRDADGKQHCRSTGSRTKKQAEAIAEEYERGAREQRTLRQLTRVLDQMHERLSGQKVVRLSVAEHIAAWLAATKLEVSPATYAFYSSSAAKLATFLGQRSLAAVAKSDLIAYRALLARELGPSTVNHHLTLVRMLFKAARRDGLLTDDPAEHLESVKSSGTTKRRAFALEELQALLTVCDPEWRSLILFGLYTGQRLGDLARLTWANLDLTKNELRFDVAKTGTSLTLPLAPALRAHVNSLPTPAALATPLHPRAAAVSGTSTLSSRFEGLLVKAGLREKKPHKKPERDGLRRESSALSFHSLRHSTVSLLHGAGLPQAVVQAYVGHSDAQTNALYTHVGLDSLERAARALPELT